MPVQAIDLRSDTITRPTVGMREAMLEADVGDDVFGEDTTVNRLQERIAEMLGKEAALYVPSGTMSNLLAVQTHTQPGDELICEAGCHIYNYEQAGFAQICGASVRPVEGQQGLLTVDQLQGLIRPENDHLARTRLVCLENTHNRGSGRVLPFDDVQAICDWAHEHELVTHLDGARLFNAAVASGISASRWSKPFDTVSVCFSKGLGAPVGSALAGSAKFIRRARRYRKLLGGGMRQAGVIAAAALYALEHHVDRMAEDHAHARQIALAVDEIKGLSLPGPIDTNIVYIRVDPKLGTAAALVEQLATRGVLTIDLGPQDLRVVTHLDVTSADIEKAVEILRDVVLNPDSSTRPDTGKQSLYN